MDDSSDSTLRKRLEQAEQALERSERRAVASRYAGAIMHEVNNPLEAIMNLVYLTKVHKDDPAQVIENMEVMDLQLQTLASVTHQALSFHREQTEAKEFDLVDIAESALKLHADKFMRHKVSVDRQLHGPAIAKAFGNELLQVISNLILNAVEALPAEKGRISVRVRTNRDTAFITVSDNGQGVPEPFAARLFEPYLTTKKSGTGLGLWLSKRIIVKHKGTLRFRTRRSGARMGTSFRITLPLAA